jgi:hypothetical protein
MRALPKDPSDPRSDDTPWWAWAAVVMGFSATFYVLFMIVGVLFDG